jgi:hypothetical protein
MSKIKPNILTPPNPVGIDTVISQLQTAIAAATYTDENGDPANWFDEGLILPLADRDQETEEPIVYWTQNDYRPAQPDDDWRTVAFFYQEDPAAAQSQISYSYIINLVVWFNQDRFTRNKNYKIREYFITEVLNILRGTLKATDQTTFEVYRELESIYSNYDINLVREKLKYPYQAFRITLTASSPLECGPGAKMDLQP